ncbi:MAG: tRNA (adenosine(37)-N6)-threonylcarbamoyltransferase complex transferase subunit TsaD [Cyclobacteriaceae bacterium]|nr:tRNA (adenosine(37)-N6)-threonylcarbamoyltransferase complex transferase subunit TsaD [Cyclobacteriaceae bacterium]
MHPLILAIESSCDETSAALIRNGKVLNNIIASQRIHEQFGGVVPELASRAHQQNIWRVVDQALREANVDVHDLDAIAFTRGPGLLGSLLVGASFAKGLALGLGKPLLDVHHMQAHVLAHFIDDPVPSFPFLCLTVSGGHTQLVVVRNHLNMEVIGETRDDAVGEAFDKAAKILGLPYPGGPLIDRYAQEGNPKRFSFPGADIPGLDFSFSGIKTAFLYFLRDQVAVNPNFIAENLADICASLQRQLVNMLMQKLRKAVRETGIRQVALAGGVSANRGLRAAVHAWASSENIPCFVPELQYCTDNAAMIAIAAHFKYLAGDFADLTVAPLAGMEMERTSA